MTTPIPAEDLPCVKPALSRLKKLIACGLVVLSVAFVYANWPHKESKKVRASDIVDPSAVLVFYSTDGYECRVPVNFKEHHTTPVQEGDMLEAYWRKVK